MRGLPIRSFESPAVTRRGWRSGVGGGRQASPAGSATFVGALAEAGFTSWIGDNHGTTEWLVKKWGDVYLHETVISHVRRLLDNEFPCARLNETPAQFQLRMRKVQAFMNSQDFAAKSCGRGLAGLAKDLKMRCKEVLDRSGERIPH